MQKINHSIWLTMKMVFTVCNLFQILLTFKCLFKHILPFMTISMRIKSAIGHRLARPLQAMQLETKEGYILNGKVKTYKELIQMGYTSSSYRQVPKASIPVYPQLQKYDFTEGCVDVMKIYEEVKQEKLNMEQGMQMNM